MTGLGYEDFADVEVSAPGEEVAFRRSWQPVDLTTVLDGSWRPAEPTVGCRSDKVGLFYPGKMHTVSSETEAGKTWFMLSAVLDELDAGRSVVYVDFEDDAGSVVGRLLTLGGNQRAIAERFHYVRPEDALAGGIHRDDLDYLLAEVRPSLAVLDGITEAMTMHGLDPNSNSDAATFGRLLPRRLAAAGAASVSLDHVTKSAEGRGRYSIGAVHKLNGIDGAAYTLENRTPFGVGMTGRSSVRISKDRPGQLRKHAVPSAGGTFWFADLVLTSHGDDFAEVEVAAPIVREAGTFRPTAVMAGICRALTEQGKPLSGAQLEALVTGKASTIREARALLQVDGYLSEKSPFELLKPWQEEAA